MATIIVFVAWLHLLQPVWLANIMTVTAVMVGGYPLYRESFAALRKGRVNMELSMVIAIVASLIVSQFLPAIAIAFFALLSEFIEGLIVQKGRRDIQILYNRTPKKAIIRKHKAHESAQEEQVIPISIACLNRSAGKRWVYSQQFKRLMYSVRPYLSSNVSSWVVN
jgi:cation transport ATPase